MTKEDLIELLWKSLKTNVSLHFLSRLEPEEIKTLIACVRDSPPRRGVDLALWKSGFDLTDTIKRILTGYWKWILGPRACPDRLDQISMRTKH